MDCPEVNDERVVVHVPTGTEMAIEMAAVRAQLSPAQFARRLLLDGLRANGFDLADLGVAARRA